MKLFLDTGNVEEIRKASSLGIIDGVTTNPTLIAREKRPFEKIIREICSIVDGPISAEVISVECRGMVEEARKLAKIHKNIVIKIPLVAEGLKAVKILKEEGIKTNVTLCFTPGQALLAAKAGGTFVSPFVGRLENIGHNGMDLVRGIKTIYKNYDFKTEIIVASVKNPLHVIEAALAGADIATISLQVLEGLLNYPLTSSGLETFLKDWEKIPK